MGFGGNPEAFEDFAGTSLGGVAVVFEHDLLELGIALGVERFLGPGQQFLLLDHRRPELPVSHQHYVEDAVVLVGEVVLAQYPEF